ncbi:uncharacterized protein N7477_002807 [Penicillium maclennaniae]|uniref:uncharacterized protein n=1 Tax=Penicillium maclennaniae TaxID=1343394 RepID=UPI0025416786|nr:uncharacterized protein N7477_002807 [Penicillium maclennaniae]KAJ5677174.1 hypothetical protein N7477_002807 [Penicillium maclennaniae]
MKLIVAGATGLVGSELIKQSLQMSAITQVIALARKPVQIDNVDSSKLKNVTIKDYGEYSEQVRSELAAADACIWTVGVTPLKSKSFDFSEVKRICQDCTLVGFKTIYEAGSRRPFRFVYFSGEGIMEDPGAKKPFFLGDYMIMRSRTEAMVRKLPEEYQGIEVCVARPGMITSSNTWARAAMASAFSATNFFTRAIPNVTLEEVSSAVLNQIVNGFEKEVLSNADLVRLGQAAYEVKET